MSKESDQTGAGPCPFPRLLTIVSEAVGVLLSGGRNGKKTREWA